MSVRRAWHGLLAFVRRRQLDGELDEEIIAHLELAERDALARGLSPAEAKREARMKFGGVQQIRESHREERSHSWMENFWRDVRLGLHTLRKSPGFSAIVIIVLALGIGANVAMFSVIDAVLLTPLPFPEPDRMVQLWEAPRPNVYNATQPSEFLDWQRLGTNFSYMTSFKDIHVAMTGKGQPVRLQGQAVTIDYFHVFGDNVLMGRTFQPDDGRPGAANIIVLSNAAWKTYFGADPEILNKHVVLDGESHQVIGVLAPGGYDKSTYKFWKPLIFTPEEIAAHNHWLEVHARMKPGITLAQAREQMKAVHTALTANESEEVRKGTIEVQSLSTLLIGDDLRRSVLIGFGAVMLVLLIACANVANLLLARGATRSAEMAVRASMGASRNRLVGQLLTETLVLSLLGAACGLFLAYVLIQLAQPLLVDYLPFTAEVHLNWKALLFAAFAALFVSVLAGILPALQTSFVNLVSAMQRGGRGTLGGTHARVRKMIVVGEVALSLILVSGALLLLSSLLKLQRLDTGVQIERVLTMTVDLPENGYETPEKAALFYRSLSERMQSAPGVTNVGISTYLPLQWIGNGEGLQIAGPAKVTPIRFKRVDAGYFSTLQIPVIAGRGISTQDIGGALPVTVINQGMAKLLLEQKGMQQPVGQIVVVSSPGFSNAANGWLSLQIVGIIRSERTAGPGQADPPVFYVPMAQVPTRHADILVRTSGDPSAVMPGIREAMRQVDSNIPLGDVRTMEEVKRTMLAGNSNPAWLIGIFACIAVVLTAIGLYGVLSQIVLQQRRELGIRMALGASAVDVLKHVIKNALGMTLLGLVIGIFGVFALTRIMSSLLFDTSPLDPIALALACVTMLLIGLFAGFIPANRASRLDPVTTLRDEG